MRKNEVNTTGAQAAILALLVLSACTKQIPYEETEVDAKSKVSSISTLGLTSGSGTSKYTYLYSASMQNASRSSSDALPFSSGDNKRVTLELGETTLRIIEVERDARYSANKTNNKMVLEIPIEHVEYQCAKDKYGECTNKEEEAKDISWKQKTGIRITKLEEARSGQLDLLPIMISQTTGDNCYDEVSSKLISSQITDTAINFQVERIFKAKMGSSGEGDGRAENESLFKGEKNAFNGSSNRGGEGGGCSLGAIDGLSDATVSAVFHYSLVRLDQVLSPDYKVIPYPQGSADERTFGFFSSNSTKLDVDNNKTDKSSVQIMNRWNPNRETIEYYLSDEFAKPENKVIKDLTYKTIDNLNAGLKISGVKFRINLNEPQGKVPGDIRNSMIVLVEDPVASNIIGYGPQTEDPVTGEIISARTVMFLGTIKKFISSTYDELLEEKKAGLASTKKTTLASKLMVAPALQAQLGNTNALLNKSAAKSKTSDIAKTTATPATASPAMTLAKLNSAKQLLKNYTATVNPQVVGTDLKSRLKYQLEAKNCAFAPAMDSFGGGISEKLLKLIPDDAKPWEQLTANEKEAMIAVILPEIWVPTLIHEMGHNLGLRHNFQASEDKDNFYSASELAANGIDHLVPFSSVMDYGNDLRTLSVLGKYDIAALRFGYLRQVDIQDVKQDPKTGESTITGNHPISLDSTLEQFESGLTGGSKLQLKSYGYCTDEHVGINAGCKRFDLGTTYLEITQNLIKDYENTYTKRNFRNGRASMSLMDDLAYASRIKSTFQELRIMMEVFERIKFKYGADIKEWETVPWLKDLKQSAITSGLFLANVLMVPDTTCVFVERKSDGSLGNQLTAVENLERLNTMIGTDAMSCAALPPIKMPTADGKQMVYVSIGQAGKAFNSKKDPQSTNAYADQIDVRGIWPDKLMAASMLLKRQIGIFTMDEHADNFLNIAELRQPILDNLGSILLNEVKSKVDFTLVDGSTLSLNINYDLFDTQKINKPLSSHIAYAMGLSTAGPTQLQGVIANKMAANLVDESGDHEQDQPLADLVTVGRYSRTANISAENDTLTLVLGATKFVASPSNVLAQQSIANYQISSILSQVEPAKLAEIITAKTANQSASESATDLEKAVWTFDVATLTGFANGTIKSPEFYSRMLNILPSEN